MKHIKTYEVEFLKEDIIPKLYNSASMYIKRKIYHLTSLLHPIKSMKNIYVALMNSIEDLVTTENIKEKFMMDYQDIIRMVLHGEITKAKEFSREYNTLLRKYGYRDYQILTFDKEFK